MAGAAGAVVSCGGQPGVSRMQHVLWAGGCRAAGTCDVSVTVAPGMWRMAGGAGDSSIVLSSVLVLYTTCTGCTLVGRRRWA